MRCSRRCRYVLYDLALGIPGVVVLIEGDRVVRGVGRFFRDVENLKRLVVDVLATKRRSMRTEAPLAGATVAAMDESVIHENVVSSTASMYSLMCSLSRYVNGTDHTLSVPLPV
jgi:hypothetical protein